MGCWNGTCGITQLPIMVGDPVAVFLLIDNNSYGQIRWSANGHYYPTDYFTPRSIQLYGEYDDYGWYNFDEHNWHSKFTVAAFQNDLIELELGENKSHDIAVNKKSINSLDSIGKAIHEDRLFVSGKILSIPEPGVFIKVSVNRIIGSFAVHRRVFDAIVNYGIDQYDKPISVSLLMKQANECITAMRAYVNEDDLFPKFHFKYFHRDRDNIFSNILSADSLDDVAGTHLLYLDKLYEMVTANATDDEFKSVLEELVKYFIFLSSMSNLRKTWIPQCGLGGQVEALDLHRVVMEAGLTKIIEREKEYEE